MGNICYIIAVWAKTPIITINYDWKIQIDQSHIFKWMWETKWGYQTDSTSLAAKPEQSVYHFRGMNTIKPDRTLKIHYIIQIRQKFKETMRTLLKLDHRCLSILAEILCRLRGCAEVGSDWLKLSCLPLPLCNRRSPCRWWRGRAAAAPAGGGTWPPGGDGRSSSSEN